ncbi:MAG: 3-methylcrotonyl-CoA carboxylase alpha subunit [Gammaproteobacteria bacterium]|jgi:3-methylcrotonyl-CoA carboxylase alpha subunit
MFNKILIANRGEIAVRIARTARQLGVKTVAVYSEADVDSLHVERCDEAVCIGPAPVSESYLCGDKILEAALQTSAQAIHPGYGFLSENSGFAAACHQAGLVFIGPPASAINAMGSKSEAKKLMADAGVPLIPGYHGVAQDFETLEKESSQIGYPQLVKASAGGGGKGMRVVESFEQLSDAIDSAKREALSSFGDDRLLIERYLQKPRHIEMQIFADGQGNCVHLFERDCSIQRRHQKVLEEAPAPGMNETLREKMGLAAIQCAKAIGYEGAGTIEFLLDSDGSFYFMEMNTRLQVEHPVTEMITGFDLVEWQLRIASGESLALDQSAISAKGHAIEVRVYAETPHHDFMPSSGQVHYLSVPQSGKSVRIDSGVRRGDQVGIYYDPMIAKLIVHGENRAQAIETLEQVLPDFRLLGFQTNLGFLSDLIALDDFKEADLHTGFIAEHPQLLELKNQSELVLIAASMALLPGLNSAGAMNTKAEASPWENKNNWRVNLPFEFRCRLSFESAETLIAIQPEDQSWRVQTGDQAFKVSGFRIDDNQLNLTVDQTRYEIPVAIFDDHLEVWLNGQNCKVERCDRHYLDLNAGAQQGEICSPMPGSIIACHFNQGDVVNVGDTLIVLEAMKMEHSISASIDGKIIDLLVAVGDQVEDGQPLLVME